MSNEHQDYINQTFAGGVAAYVSDLQSRVASGNVSQEKVNAELSRIGYTVEPSFTANYGSIETSRSYTPTTPVPAGGGGGGARQAETTIQQDVNYYRELLKPTTDMFNRYDENDKSTYNPTGITNMPNPTAIGNITDTIAGGSDKFLNVIWAIMGGLILILFLGRK